MFGSESSSGEKKPTVRALFHSGARAKARQSAADFSAFASGVNAASLARMALRSSGLVTLESFVTAVATGGALGLLAVAERHGGGFVHHYLLGTEFGSLVGSVTEGLFFGIATGTPVIGSRFQLDHRRFCIRNVRFAHIV